MSNGIAAAMNASGQFEVSVIPQDFSKRVKVAGKFWKKPHIGLWFSSEWADCEVLRDPSTEKWLAEITGAKQVTKWEFHT